MAEAKKCDRCGEFYIGKPKNDIFVSIDRPYCNHGLDLCQDCIDQLRKWLGNNVDTENGDSND